MKCEMFLDLIHLNFRKRLGGLLGNGFIKLALSRHKLFVVVCSFTAGRIVSATLYGPRLEGFWKAHGFPTFRRLPEQKKFSLLSTLFLSVWQHFTATRKCCQICFPF